MSPAPPSITERFAPTGPDHPLSPSGPADMDLQRDVHARFFSGLANSTRLAIVELLLERGEMSVGQLVEAVGKSQGQVSNQLGCLRWCGYVSSRSEGRQVFYRLADRRIAALLGLAREIVVANAERIRSCVTVGREHASAEGDLDG